MTITIIGLGPGPVEDMSLRAWKALESAPVVYLRTERHPCVPDLPPSTTYHSFDHLYETLEAFEDVYSAITARIIEAAEAGDVVYAVPGDPFVGESTPALIMQAAAEREIPVEIINGISFIEPMLKLIGVDAIDGLQIVDGLTVANMHHPPLNPEQPALLAQVYSRDVASNIKLTMMNQYPDEFGVTLIHGAGTDSAQVEHLPLYEIDRSEHINHLTSLYVPPLGEYTSFQAFQEIIAHLRAPEGCPWDRKQTHLSLRPYLIEEAYEVLEAIDKEDPTALAGELGDLLLQIVLHTQIAIEYGEFYMSDVLEYVNRKMIRRHPHVWGDVDVDGNPEKVTANWEQIKQSERADDEEAPTSRLDGLPPGMPALMIAYKYSERAAKVGFDWDSIEGVEDKVREEMAEIFDAKTADDKIHEIGDLLFAIVSWLRWLGVDDPESLLRQHNAKFYQRFKYIEVTAAVQGRDLKDMTMEEMQALWDDAKEADHI